MLWVEGKSSTKFYIETWIFKFSCYFCSLILNPNGAYYESLKSALKYDFEDLLWSEDAVFLERNSRTFKERSHTINKNTESLCNFLINHPKGKNWSTKRHQYA